MRDPATGIARSRASRSMVDASSAGALLVSRCPRLRVSATLSSVESHAIRTTFQRAVNATTRCTALFSGNLRAAPFRAVLHRGGVVYNTKQRGGLWDDAGETLQAVCDGL